MKRISEPVSTDTIYCDTLAVDNGSKCAQVFVGTKNMLSDVHDTISDKIFINSLEDNIRQRGDIDKLVSDNAK